ncbi:uncharacterized protein LOC128275631 isoform X2 [Anopheles cruzii]|uniref:uncharacterized protein LOC128275631 isoform X2 n=1 Tax=Anopheles cruzii TaxID=68878 RepID=UPI0022EC4EF8|nr:uncharacterized protein LOC128275631 isoform X2 [Anopheles cruzii]
MDVPSMVQRSGDKLIVRRVVSGEQVILSRPDIKAEAAEEADNERQEPCYRRSSLIDDDDEDEDNEYDDDDEDDRLSRAEQVLPQCKVKRNYSCGHCRYFTQNPRHYLTHLRDTHGEKIVINGCPRCLYASRHHQKLVRHMKMVHGAGPTASEPWPDSDSARTPRTVVKQELIRPHRRQPHTDSPKHPRKGSTPSARNTQQQQLLVASGLSDLLLEIQQSWNRTIADTNFGLGQKTLKLEMDGLPSLVTASDEAPLADDRSSPRKRHRPIPNLIPLAGGRPAKEAGLKPVPMSALMPAQTATTKCTFCELVYESTVELANHIAAAHKEDLITSLLQKSIDDSGPGAVVLLPSAEHDSTSSSSDVWKTLLESSLGAPTGAPDDRKQTPDANDDEVEILENKSETYCGIETAPGYGEVTNTITAGGAAGVAGGPSAGGGVMKKVFKCPHCSFWASTASRFHVHIVGHLNKKPFECSLCAYRSNWRWDITKHIRLKTIRDPSHKNAGVLMNDETGRRNYTKYNKYITLMQITDHNAKDAAAGGGASNHQVTKSLVGGAVTDLMTACRTYNIDLQTITSLPGFKLLLQQQQQDDKHPEDSATREDIKCPVCDHSASTKEELVLHMTNVHITLPAGIPTIPLDDTTTESDTVAAPDPGPAAEPQNCTPSTSFGSQTTNPCVDRSPTNGTLVGDGAASDKPMLELGDGGDSSGGGGGGAGGSTQKRHCRLKHNGNVFIELTTSADESTTTVVVDGGDGGGHYLRGGGTKPTNQHSFYVVEEGVQTTTEMPTVPPLAPFGSIHDELSGAGCPASSTLEPIVEINDKDATDLIGLDRMLGSPSAEDPTADSPLDGAFNVDSLEDSIDILAQGTVPTCLYYCPRCPARFFGEAHITEHLERHGAGTKRCTVCSFGTPNDEELARHAEVHTAQYNKSTENLQLFLDEHATYRRPTLTLRVRSGGEQVWSVKVIPQPSEVTTQPAATVSGGRKSKRLRSDGEQAISSRGPPQVRSIFLCEYCDSAFDGESELNGHVRGHFAAILAPAEVAYYASLNNASLLAKDNQFELTVSGTQQQPLAADPMPLRYVYDNGRRKEWSSFSKADSVLLKL